MISLVSKSYIQDILYINYVHPCSTSERWMTSFDLENCDFTSTGKNSYFVLEPEYQVILEGEEDSEILQMVMTVLNETK